MYDLNKSNVDDSFDFNEDLLRSNNPLVFNGKIWLLFNSGKPRIIVRARNNWSQLYSCVWTVTN
jgi:hypothetical protein